MLVRRCTHGVQATRESRHGHSQDGHSTLHSDGIPTREETGQTCNASSATFTSSVAEERSPWRTSLGPPMSVPVDDSVAEGFKDVAVRDVWVEPLKLLDEAMLLRAGFKVDSLVGTARSA